MAITQTIKIETEGADKAAEQFKLLGNAVQKTGEQFGGLVKASEQITSTGASLADKFKSISDVFATFGGKANEMADGLNKIGGAAGTAGSAIATVGEVAGTTASTIASFGGTVTQAAGTMVGLVKSATEAGTALTAWGAVLPGLSAAFTTASAAIVTAVTAVAAAVQRAVIAIIASLGPVGIAIAALSVAAALYFNKVAADAEKAANKAKEAFDKLVDEVTKNSTKLSQAVTKAADDAAVAAEKAVQAQIKLQEARLKEAQLAGDRSAAADAQQRIIDLTRQLAQMQTPLAVAIRERHAAEREALASTEAAAKAALASNQELAAALRQTGEFKIDASALKELDTTILTIKGRLGEVKDAGGNVEEALARIIRALPPDQAVGIGAKLGLSEAEVAKMQGNVGIIERLLKSLPIVMEVAAAGVDKTLARTKQIWFSTWAAMAEVFADFLAKIGAKTRSDEVKQWAEGMRASAADAGKDWEAANKRIADSYKPIATEATKAGDAAATAAQTATTGYSPFFASTEEAKRRAKEWGDESEKSGQKATQAGRTAAEGSRTAADEYKKQAAAIDGIIKRLASSEEGKQSLALDIPRLQENAREAGQKLINALNNGLQERDPELFNIISKNAELAKRAAEGAMAAVHGPDVAKLRDDADLAAQDYINAVKSGLQQRSPGAFQAIEEEADRAKKALAETIGDTKIPKLDWTELTLGAQEAQASVATATTTPASDAWAWVPETYNSAVAKVNPAAAQAAAAAATTTPTPGAWQWIVDAWNAMLAKLGFGGGKSAAPAADGGGGNAGGGLLGGRGTGTSDSNLAWVSRGEYIVPARIVRQPGMLALLEALRLSRFAAGGVIGGIPAYAGGGQVGSDKVVSVLDRVMGMIGRIGQAVGQMTIAIIDSMRKVMSDIDKAMSRFSDSSQAIIENAKDASDTLFDFKQTITGRAGGGLLGGRGTGTSDSNLAWLSRGEYVVPARAVQRPGVLQLLEALRLGGMRGFALGGMVAPTLSLPAFAGGGAMHHVTIQFPGLPEISGLRASSAVVDELRKAAAMAQVRSGGRKPSRYS